MKQEKHYFELIDKEIKSIEEDLSIIDCNNFELAENIEELNFDRA